MTAVLSATTYKVLAVLRNHPLQEFKEIELIQTARTGKGATGLLIDRLVQEGILRERRIGRTKLISFPFAHPKAFFLKNFLDQERLERLSLSRKAAALLFKREAEPALSLLVLFGSTIAGTATSRSDMDLLVVSENLPIVEKARRQAEECTGERLNLHIYNERELKEGIGKDSFIRNALLQGVILYGYDRARTAYASIERKEAVSWARIEYFKERLAAARRNYGHKDMESAQEIITPLLEQVIFYVLTVRGISYQSKKDAWRAIRTVPEGKALVKIGRSPLREKIDKLEVIMSSLVIKAILAEEGYGLKNGD